MRVLYDGLEWFAVQATQDGVCFCSGRKKHFRKGDWILTRNENGWEMKVTVSGVDFERDFKVIA